MKPRIKSTKTTKSTPAAPAASTPSKTIAVKFVIGDTAWAIRNNKAVTLSIEGIKLYRDMESPKVRTRYFTSDGDWLDGNQLFASKPELLASL